MRDGFKQRTFWQRTFTCLQWKQLKNLSKLKITRAYEWNVKSKQGKVLKDDESQRLNCLNYKLRYSRDYTKHKTFGRPHWLFTYFLNNGEVKIIFEMWKFNWKIPCLSSFWHIWVTGKEVERYRKEFFVGLPGKIKFVQHPVRTKIN